MDRADPLASFRSRFHIPKRKDGTDSIYFCGNSLGLQPKTAREYVMQEMDDWQTMGVEGHFHAKHPWMPYHELLTDQTARLAGALPAEVVVMNTLTVNLHLLLVSFYRPTGARHRIVIESHAFPSDRYAVESQIRFHGFDPSSSLVELKPRNGEDALRTDDILAFLDREGRSVALVMLGGVNYYTGQAFDMAAITEAAHRQGCVAGYDLAHAAGNVLLNLHDWNVDFAVWCSYKYLNAGPGGPAGCFVHERHARDHTLPRFAGWWGHNKTTRFQMGPDFDPIPGAEGWQLSNPPILPLAALRASLEIFDEATMSALRAKSELLTGYLAFLLRGQQSAVFRIITPDNPPERGCQLSLLFSRNGRGVFDHLTAQGVVADWREPDVIRIAPVPLYNTFEDVYEFARLFQSVVGSRESGESLSSPSSL
jgi:kynureninase